MKTTRRARTLGDVIERKADTESEGYIFTGDAHDLIVYGAKFALAEVRRRLRKLEVENNSEEPSWKVAAALKAAINCAKWRSK